MQYQEFPSTPFKQIHFHRYYRHDFLVRPDLSQSKGVFICLLPQEHLSSTWTFFTKLDKGILSSPGPALLPHILQVQAQGSKSSLHQAVGLISCSLFYPTKLFFTLNFSPGHHFHVVGLQPDWSLVEGTQRINPEWWFFWRRKWALGLFFLGLTQLNTRSAKHQTPAGHKWPCSFGSDKQTALASSEEEYWDISVDI